MANIIEIPFISPLKFFQQSDLTKGLNTSNTQLGAFNPLYNNRPFDKDFFLRNLKSWEDKVTYAQPFQIGDTLLIYFVTPRPIAEFELNLLDTYGNVKYNTSTFTTAGGLNGYYHKIGLWDFDEGIYYAQIKYTPPSPPTLPDIYFISEPFHVKREYENTILLEYENSYNTHNVNFSSGDINFQYRIHGLVSDLNPKGKLEVYEDQPLNQTLLNGVPFREWRLMIGGNGSKVPPYVADLINRASCCDTFKIDGINYTRDGESDLEATRDKNYPLMEWAMPLRETINNDSLELDEYEATYYALGTAPISDRFYVDRLERRESTPPYSIVGTDYFRQEFTSVKALCAFIEQWFKTFHSVEVKVVVTDERQIVMIPVNGTAVTFLNSNIPTLAGILYNYISIKVDTSSAPTVEFTAGGTPNNYANWGDGTTKSYNTTTANKVYTNVGEVTAYYYWDSATTLNPNGSSVCISELGGMIIDNLTQLNLASQKLKYVDNSLFLYYSGALNLVELEDNVLNSSEINKLIIMIYELLQSGRCASSGTLTMDIQTPSAPPTNNSLLAILAKLKASWTVNTD